MPVILWITHNDNGGNCQIRFGNRYSNLDERYTAADSGAAYIGQSIDSTQSALTIKVASDAVVADDDPVTWGKVLSVGYDNLTWNNMEVTNAGDVQTLTNKTLTSPKIGTMSSIGTPFVS